MTARVDFGTRLGLAHSRPDPILTELEARRSTMRHYAKIVLVAGIPLGVAAFLVEPFDPSGIDRFGDLIDIPERIADQLKISGISLSPRRAAEITSRIYPVLMVCILPMLIAIVAMNYLRQWTALLVLSLIFLAMVGCLDFPSYITARIIPFMIALNITLYIIHNASSMIKLINIMVFIFASPYLSALIPYYGEHELTGISISVKKLGLTNASQRQIEKERPTATSATGQDSATVAPPGPRYSNESKKSDDTTQLRTAIARIERINGQRPAANYVAAQLSYLAADPRATNMSLAKLDGAGADLGPLAAQRLEVLKTYVASFTEEKSGLSRHLSISYWFRLALSWGLTVVAVFCLMYFILIDIITTRMVDRIKRIKKLKLEIALRLVA